jgi:hypothetical protein
VARAGVPPVPRWRTGRQSPDGTRAVSPRWHTGRQSPGGTRAVRPRWRTGRQSPGGTRAVSPRWRTGRQSPVAHGPSVPDGARAVSPQWHTGRQSPTRLAGRATSTSGFQVRSGSRPSAPSDPSRPHRVGVPGRGPARLGHGAFTCTPWAVGWLNVPARGPGPAFLVVAWSGLAGRGALEHP